MKIRRSILWICAGIIAALVLLVWFSKQTTKNAIETGTLPDTTKKPSVRPSQQPSTSPIRTNLRSMTRTSQTAPTTNANQQTRKSKEERISEELSFLNDVPIVFYGKLEDQFGQPIANALITGSILQDNGHISGVREIKTVSDVNGLFHFNDGKGESLSVIPRKSGYAISSTNAAFKYSYFYPEVRHVPDPLHPRVITMWKLQGTEPLTQIDQSYKLHYTDAPIYFDLPEKKIVSSGGDIKISVVRSSGDLSLRNRQDWSLEIEAVDGGLIKTSGQESVTYWAPESGYESSSRFLFSTNTPYKWFEGFTEGFFVMSRNGKVYSKLGLSFRINEKPESFMYIRFGGVANTNGSRNWEGDPNTYKPQ